jgi:primary-amine oxidase
MRYQSLGTALYFFAVAAAIPGPKRTWDHHSSSKRLAPRQATCKAPVDVHTTAKIATPFKSFSDLEVEALTTWLFAPERGLNLTNASSPDLSISDNYLYHIEPLLPNKTDVLSYLDANGPAPPTYARVVVNEGGKAEPDATEYYVSIASGFHLIVPSMTDRFRLAHFRLARILRFKP